MAKFDSKAAKEQINIMGIIDYDKDKNSNGIINETKKIKIKDIMDNEANANLFRNQTDEEYAGLKESIKELGILEPITVQFLGYGIYKYKIISGHHRKKAMLELGFDEIPAYIIDLQEDDQDLALIHANIKNRRMSAMEYARVIEKEKLILQKKSRISGNKINIIETLAENLNMSSSQIKRIGSLNKLIPSLKTMVDSNILPVSKASEIAFLPEEIQTLFLDTLKENISYVETNAIKELKQKTTSQAQEYVAKLNKEQLEKESLKLMMSKRDEKISLLEANNKKHIELQEEIVKNNKYIEKLNKDLETARTFKPLEMDGLRNELVKAKMLSNEYKKKIEWMESKANNNSKASIIDFIEKDKNIFLNESEKSVLKIIDSMDNKNIEIIINVFNKIL